MLRKRRHQLEAEEVLSQWQISNRREIHAVHNEYCIINVRKKSPSPCVLFFFQILFYWWVTRCDTNCPLSQFNEVHSRPTEELTKAALRTLMDMDPINLILMKRRIYFEETHSPSLHHTIFFSKVNASVTTQIHTFRLRESSFWSYWNNYFLSLDRLLCVRSIHVLVLCLQILN